MSLLQFSVHADYEEVVRLRSEIEKLENTLKNFGPGTAESTIRSLQIQLSQCRDQLQKLISEAATAGASLERTVNQSLANIRRNGNVNVSVNADTKEFHYRMLETDKDFQDVMKNLDTYTAKLSGFFSSLSSLAGFTAPLMGVLGFLNQVKETRTYFQDIESTMTVLLGSEEKSLEFCKQLEDAAYWNMFEYADLVGASKQMIAYGVATDQIIPKINQLSEVATATKGSLDEMVGMYNRAKAIGYVDSRALQTWATHGLVVKDVLKEMGEEVHGTKVTFEQLNKVLDHVTGEGGMFHNVMANQMQNISAEIGALEDNTSLMFNEIGEDLQEPLTKVIKVAGMLVKHWKEVAGVLATAGTAYGIMRMARGADTAAFNAELDETKKKLEELHRERQKLVLDEDIQQGVDAGKYTREDAEKLQNNRNELKAAGADNKTLKQLEEEARQRIAVADAIEEEKAKLAELQQAQNQPQVKLDDDLQGMVNSGQASMEQVSELQKARDAVADLQKEKEKALTTAQSELDFNDQLFESYKKDREVAQERKDKADELVASLQEQYDQQELLKAQYEQQGMSAEDAAAAVNEVVSASELEAAQREQAAAAAALEEAQKDANTAAEMRNAAAAEAEALSERASALANGQASAAEATNTAATNANTGATNTNTAAQTKNTLATKLGAMADRAGATAKLILKNAVDSVKTSMHALKAAIISNPIGMLITAITTVIGLFMTFKKETESASAEVERFGESAIKTRNNAELLYSVLKSTAEGSKVHKEALTELEKIAKEYGFTLDDEKDKYEQLIGLRGQLIKLIEEEGRQRQIANNIAAYQKDQEDLTQNFVDKLASHIKDENDDERTQASASIFARTIAQAINETDEKRAEIMAVIDELDQKEKELSLEAAKGEYADAAKMAQLRAEIGKARTDLLHDLNTQARDIAQDMGIKYQLDLNDVYGYVREYTKSLDASSKAMEGYVEKQQENAERLAALKPAPEIDVSSMNIDEVINALESIGDTAEEVSGKDATPKADPSKIADVKTSAEEATEATEVLSETDGTPSADTEEIDAVTDAADVAASATEDLANTDGSPSADTSEIDAVTDAANTATAAVNSGSNAVFKPKMDLSWFEKGYDWIRKMASELGLELPDLGTGAGGAGKSTSTTPTAPTKTDYKSRLTELVNDVNTNESAGDMRRRIKALQDKTKWGSADYKYYQGLLDSLDKRDPSKKNRGNGKGKHGGGKKDDPLQRAYDLKKMMDEESERLEKMERERIQSETDLRIKMMQDGTEKEIATIHNDAKKKRDALEDDIKKEVERIKDLEMKEWLKGGKDRKNYQWEQTRSDEEYLAEARQNLGVETTLADILYDESTAIQKIYQEDITSMRDYLKEYGTFEQRKLAIAQEYAEKIRKATTEGERLKLEQEQASALDNVEIEAIKSKIDWYSVFDNVGLVMKGQLEPLYNQLKAYVTTDAFKTSDASSQRAIVDAMENLRTQLGDNGQWKDLSSALTDYQNAIQRLNATIEQNNIVTEEANRLQNAYDEALRTLDNLTRDENATPLQIQEAQKAVGDAKAAMDGYAQTVANSNMAMQDAQNEVSATGMVLSQSAKSVTQPINKIYTFLNNYGLPQLAELWHQFDLIKGGIDGLTALKDASKKAAEAGKEVSEAGKKVGEGANGVAKKLKDKVSDKVIEGLDAAGLVGQIVSAVMSILEILGDGIGTFISNIIDTVLSSITGILDNLLSGEFAIQIGESLVKGIGGIFKSITTMGGLFDWWGNGESDPKLEEDIERLTLTNEALRKAIEDLTDEMKDASITDAADLYLQTKDDIDASMRNTQEMMQRSGAAYSNGFLGIGGKHSSNHKINGEMSSDDWARVSKAAGASVKSAGDFWKLTSEQMSKVAKEAPDLYAKIKGLADDGYKDAGQFMDEYIEYWKELEELRNAYWQSLTDTNFDSVKDAFKSTLLDMESSTEDFAQSFEAMMRQAVINSLMTSKYNKLLKDWYEEFAKAMDGDGLSDDEQRRLKKEYDAIVSDAIADRDAMAKAMGWDTSTTQQASSRALQGMTQDTAEAIEGRMTAMQIAVETIRATHQIEAASIAELNDSMLTMLQTEKGYSIFYENLERQVAKIYLEVQGINENTGAMVRPIQNIENATNEMLRKIKNL